MPDVKNDDQKPRMAEIDLTELIPPGWHDQPVWISSYRAFRLPASAWLKTEPFELLGVRAQLFWGRAPIWNSTLTLRPQPDGGVVAESVGGRSGARARGAVSPAHGPDGVRCDTNGSRTDAFPASFRRGAPTPHARS